MRFSGLVFGFSSPSPSSTLYVWSLLGSLWQEAAVRLAALCRCGRCGGPRCYTTLFYTFVYSWQALPGPRSHARSMPMPSHIPRSSSVLHYSLFVHLYICHIPIHSYSTFLSPPLSAFCLRVCLLLQCATPAPPFFCCVCLAYKAPLTCPKRTVARSWFPLSKHFDHILFNVPHERAEGI
jgi:hypothetical protein